MKHNSTYVHTYYFFNCPVWSQSEKFPQFPAVGFFAVEGNGEDSGLYESKDFFVLLVVPSAATLFGCRIDLYGIVSFDAMGLDIVPIIFC